MSLSILTEKNITDPKLLNSDVAGPVKMLKKLKTFLPYIFYCLCLHSYNLQMLVDKSIDPTDSGLLCPCEVAMYSIVTQSVLYYAVAGKALH